MAFKLKILAQFELSILGYSGRVTGSDFSCVWAALDSSNTYRPDFDDLIVLGPDADYSDIGYEISMAQAEKFVAINRPPALTEPKRTAFVCAHDIQIAMARMFVAFVRTHGSSQVSVEAFKDLAAAIDWLDQSKSGASRLDRNAIRHVLGEIGQAWCLSEAAA